MREINVKDITFSAELNIFASRKLEQVTGQPISSYFTRIGNTFSSGAVSIDMCLNVLYAACWGGAKAERAEFHLDEDEFTALFSLADMEYVVESVAYLIADAMPGPKEAKGAKKKTAGRKLRSVSSTG